MPDYSAIDCTGSWSEPLLATIFEALRLRAAGAWRRLRLLQRSSTDPNQPLASALLEALCRSPLKDIDQETARLSTLAGFAPDAANAIAVSRDLLTVARIHILNEDSESASIALRQALASSLDAVRAMGITPPAWLREHLALKAEGLMHTLSAQIDLLEGSRGKSLPNQLALVLGMHRSGTSALTGMLANAGLTAPSDLLPPTPRNPRGYWESKRVMEINDRMLKSMGRSWASLSPVSQDEWNAHEHAARGWRSELLQILQTCYPDQSRAILKDPRLCPLLPGLQAWLESDLINVVFLLPVRHPTEVTASLHAAEGTPPDEGLLLWLIHVFSAERNTRGFNRLIVDYKELIRNPSAVLSCCKLILDSAEGRPQHPSAWNAEAAYFIDPSLQHQEQATNTSGDCKKSDDHEANLQLAIEVHTLMTNPELDDSARCEQMDQLHQQWESLRP